MSHDPIPAQGVGSEQFDLPSLFYLTNQALIDEWHDLSSNVAEAVSGWMKTVLKASLAGPASGRGLQLSDAAGPGGHRHLLLHPASTPVLGLKPVIGVGLAWQWKTVNPKSSPPFVCVRCSRNQTGRDAAKLFVDNGGRAFRNATPEAKGTDADVWPLWWWLKATPNWWTDLDSYRDHVVENVLRLTDAIRPALDAAASVTVSGGADESE
jgi:hypothetical protein